MTIEVVNTHIHAKLVSDSITAARASIVNNKVAAKQHRTGKNHDQSVLLDHKNLNYFVNRIQKYNFVSPGRSVPIPPPPPRSGNILTQSFSRYFQ